MEAVKISPKFQVVIPKQIRESLNLQAGQTLQIIEYGNRIELIPVKDITEMRGFLKGMSTDIECEEDRL